ncbi:MAG: TolC family protein [Bacteroidota bacterium]|jgi:outer membrane protein|nr:TolC family protein [Bacteroidota bacterium]|tara:strand:+ start:2989 stop:4320 length:1332 start_codon:yes stop_codon:yes gene_type:complete
MIKKNILFAFFISTIAFSQVDNNIISLQDAIDIALEKNINIKQSELNLDNSELGRSDAIGNFLPTIGASANHQWNVGRGINVTTNIIEEITTQFSSATASIGLPIYNGSRNVNQLHRANLEILASKYQLEDIKDDVKLFVANSYLQIMFNKEILKVQKSQLEITKVEYERTQDLIDSGIFSPRQIFEIEANLASQEQSVVQAENNLRDAKLNLAQVLLLDDYENFDIANEDFSIPFSDILENSPKEIFEKAKTFRNDIKLAETNISIAEKDIQISKSFRLPSITSFYSWNTRISYVDNLPSFNDQFDLNKGQTYGFGINIPIFQGRAISNNIQRTKINLERLKFQYEQEKLNLENTVYQAYNDLVGAIKLYEASNKTVKSLKSAFEDATDRYLLGSLNSFDFIQSKQAYEASVSENIRAKFDYIFRLKVLEFYFGLPLSVPQY